MQYLVYVSHDAENLQFWLWIQDYTKRFYASSGSDQALSPPWSEVEVTQPNGTVLEQRPRTADKRKADATELHINFETSELTPRSDRHSFVSGMAGSSRSMLTTAEDANAQIGLKWQSCKARLTPAGAHTNPRQSPFNHFDPKSILLLATILPQILLEN